MRRREIEEQQGILDASPTSPQVDSSSPVKLEHTTPVPSTPESTDTQAAVNTSSVDVVTTAGSPEPVTTITSSESITMITTNESVPAVYNSPASVESCASPSLSVTTEASVTGSSVEV